mgnify:CR=1 FL=1
MQLNLERLDFHPAMFENDYDVPLSYFVFLDFQLCVYNFGAVFINKLIIRLFDYSVFAASERTDSPGKGNAKILFNFEWP